MKIIIAHSHLGPFVSFTFIRSTKATIIKINCKIMMGNISSHGIVEISNIIPPFFKFPITAFIKESFHKLCYNSKLGGELNAE